MKNFNKIFHFPIPIGPFSNFSASLQLLEHLPLNECEQKFSFLSRYYRDRIIATSSSPCITFDLSEDAIQESNSGDFNIGISESMVFESGEESESD